MTSVSVIIPARDASHTLDAQIRAVLASCAGLEFEVIVADNGSTDGTVGVAQAWERRGADVRVVDASARAGPSAARNDGAAHAHGELLLFCDADDEVAGGWAPAIVDALSCASWATGPVDLDRLNPPWLADHRGRAWADQLGRFEEAFPFASSCNFGIRAATFDEIGGFDETLKVGEDIEICHRLWLASLEPAWRDDAVVHYRYRPELRARLRQGYAYGRAVAALHRKLGSQPPASRNRHAGMRSLAWLVRHGLDARHRAGRARWGWVASQLLGRLVGRVAR